MAKMLRRRAMIVSEFVSTEETYVSNLQLLVDRFSNTLHGVIAPADHLSIFSIAPQLVLDINTHTPRHTIYFSHQPRLTWLRLASGSSS